MEISYCGPRGLSAGWLKPCNGIMAYSASSFEGCGLVDKSTYLR